MRDRLTEIRAAGASLVIIGNGSADFARAFREELGLELEVRLLVDPTLHSYHAAGLRRGRKEVASPRLISNAWRAWRGGFRQRAVQGDAFQLGGVLVVRKGGRATFRHVDRVAGDHAPLDEVIAALAPDAPEWPSEPEPSPLERLGAEALSRLLDPTIVFSFDRTGFARHAIGFDSTDLERDLSGRRALVTGANSGIGFETALALAERGADVVLACRSEERGLAARDSIRGRSGNSRVVVERVDVSNLADVRALGARMGDRRLDILVHNAGVLPDAREETADGLERTFATHVAGPHLLTRALLPALARSDDARVIWVSSGGMYTRRLDLRDPQWLDRPYDGVLAYAATKRMQVSLARRWSKEGGPCVVAMHPGWADTPAVESSLPRFHQLARAILRTPAEGADTVVWLAVAPRAKLESGGFYFDRRRRSAYLVPGTRESARDQEALWSIVEDLAGQAGVG